MTEGELTEAVRQELEARGLLGLHVPDSRRVTLKGWPDFEIVGKSILYRELKSADGVLSSDQVTVKYRLQAAGADYAVWRPRDLQSGRIARELDDLV